MTCYDQLDSVRVPWNFRRHSLALLWLVRTFVASEITVIGSQDDSAVVPLCSVVLYMSARGLPDAEVWQLYFFILYNVGVFVYSCCYKNDFVMPILLSIVVMNH
jgi:hypothetical protein